MEPVLGRINPPADIPQLLHGLPPTPISTLPDKRLGAYDLSSRSHVRDREIYIEATVHNLTLTTTSPEVAMNNNKGRIRRKTGRGPKKRCIKEERGEGEQPAGSKRKKTNTRTGKKIE